MPLPCWLLQLRVAAAPAAEASFLALPCMGIQVAAAPAAEASFLGDLVLRLSRDTEMGQDGQHLLLLPILRPSRPLDLVILCACG